MPNKKKKSGTNPKAKKPPKPTPSRFADANLDFMTVYDKDGKPIKTG